jgi:hypothetical protein
VSNERPGHGSLLGRDALRRLARDVRGQRQPAPASDYDQAAFAVSCGAIDAPADWDGSPSRLGPAWWNFDPSDIDQCPDDYHDLAEGCVSDEERSNGPRAGKRGRR